MFLSRIATKYTLISVQIIYPHISSA
uniref:Uncharacterized protein n=1 Tax=Arundo donax TaxID=35708 RepID=A0A0A8ZMN9_ARUDO